MCAKDFRSKPGKPEGPSDPKPGKANWRGKGKAPAGRKLQKKGTSWTDRSGREYRQAKFWYRVKIGAWVGVLVAALAAYVYYLYVPEITPFLAMAQTDYGGLEYFVPPNGWAREDVEHFEELGGKRKLLRYSAVDYVSGATGTNGFSVLKKELDEARPGGPDGNLVVVYLSMHGAVNSQGQACLLAPHPEVSPYDDETWLPLAEVIRYLFPEKEREGQAEKKLLILDCNRMDANWRLGLPYNGFADRLQEALEDAGVPGLFILNSTSPGQVGWTCRRGDEGAEEFEGSVFAHFLFKGLAGDARPQSSKISLRELADYVSQEVEAWVKTNRYDLQIPMLVASDAKGLEEAAQIDVVFVPDEHPQFPKPSAERERRWEKEVAPLWIDHERLAANQVGRRTPLRWARFEQQLLRLEQLLAAGKAYEKRYEALKKDLAQIVVDFGKDPLAGDVAAYSLPLAKRYAGDTHAAVNPSWQAFLDNNTKEKWQELLGTIDQAGRPSADVVELHFARMLNSYLDPFAWKNQPGLVGRALAVRELAERAAAPQDARAHYSIQSLVNEADQKRREAEDRLFIGSEDLLEKAQSGYVEIAGADGKGGGYNEALGRGEQIQAAYAARDEAWATLPFLAQWLLDRRYEPPEVSPDEESLDEKLGKLKALAEDAYALDKKLDELLASANWPGELDGVERIHNGIQQLGQGLQRHLPQRNDVNDSKRLKQTLVALDTSLVTGSERAELRRRYLAKVTGSEESPKDGGPDHLKRVDKFPMPAMILGIGLGGNVAATQIDGVEKSQMERLAEIRLAGKNVRGRLGELVGKGKSKTSEIADEIDKTVAQFKAKLQESPAGARAGLSRADRRIRAAAALIAPGSKYSWEEEGEPGERLQRLDLHYLMLWHAYRALEDFWGPRPDEPGGNPYFQIVTRDCLESAERLVEEAGLGKKTAAVRYGETDLAQLLENRATASLLPEDNNLKVDSDQEQTSKPSPLSVTVRPGQYLPRGEAAVYLEDPADGTTIPVSTGEDSPPDVRRTGLAVGDGKKEADPCWVAKKSLPKGVIRLNAVALYRGHREPAEISVEVRGTGIPVVFEPDKYRPPVITVHGEATEGYSIMFILDCSDSMNEMIEVTVDNNTVPRPRFDIARSGLRDILSFLADRKNSYNVGLLAYGHRAGWMKDGAGGYKPSMRDPDTGNEVLRPPDQFLWPGEDVERLLEPGPFGQFEYAKISRELDKLQPLGETPLYYAIWMAAEALSTAATPTKRIIVVTDGVNEQYPGQGLVPFTPFKVDQSLKNLGGQIHLDVVEFDIDENVLPGEKKKELDALRKLAADNGGGSYPARQPGKLVEVLEKALQLSHYYVESERGGRRFPPFPEKGYQLGDPAEIEQAADAKVRYAVRFEDGKNEAQAEVELQGGEDLALYLTKDHRALQHRRYAEGVRADQDDVPNTGTGGDFRPASFYIAAHLPSRDRDTVEFQFSVQNHDQTQFSPRPAEAWIQVRPLRENGSPLLSDEGRPSDYIFYDLKFKESRPVPVIQCAAEEWPAEATKARVELFFKLEATEPRRENVRQVGDLSARGGFSVEGVPEVQFKLETRRGDVGAPFQVSIFETHPKADSGLDVVKVEMKARAGRQPPPNLVEHRFNYESGLARHTFYFNDALAADIDGYNVTFTPRTDLERGAIKLKEPMVVTIPGRKR